MKPEYLFDIRSVENDTCYDTRAMPKSELNSTAKQKHSVTLSFPSVLKNGTSQILKSEIYHRFLNSKKRF